MCGLLFPEPTYQGPENVVYLRGANGLQEELQRDTRIIWLVAFYTAWNPACVNFAPIFSELSAELVALILCLIAYFSPKIIAYEKFSDML